MPGTTGQRRPVVAGDARRHRLRLFSGPEVAYRRPHRGARRGGVHLQGGLRSGPHGAERAAGAFASGRCGGGDSAHRDGRSRGVVSRTTCGPAASGAAIAVEVHVRMDGAMTVARSHALTVDIERRLRARFGEGTMIAIHVEPLK